MDSYFARLLPEIGDFTVAGWAIAFGYLTVALLFVRARREALRLGEDKQSDAEAWWFLTALLCFLGLNKQLDLQVWLVEAGRSLPHAEVWRRRRLLQLAFLVCFGVGTVTGAGVLAWRWRRFVRGHVLAAVGAVELLGYVLVRAMEFNHKEWLLPAYIRGAHWGWLLEATGIVLVGSGALRAGPRAPRGGSPPAIALPQPVDPNASRVSTSPATRRIP